MAEVKLTNVDTVVSQNNKSLSVDSVAALTENIGSASHGDSLIFASGSWTTGQVQTSGGGSGGTVLGDTGIDVSSQTINGVTDYFYEYGSAPTLELNIVALKISKLWFMIRPMTNGSMLPSQVAVAHQP